MTEDLRKLGRFSCGFAKKKIKDRLYVYFWGYDGQGNKKEEYMGRADTMETQKKMLLTETRYFESLAAEVAARLQELKKEYQKLPANAPDEGKHGHGKRRIQGTMARGAVDGPQDPTAEEEKTQS